MYSNGQWPGHGQAETAEIFRELVEAMPEIPIGKLVNYTKAKLGKLKDMATQSPASEEGISNPMTDAQGEILC